MNHGVDLFLGRYFNFASGTLLKKPARPVVELLPSSGATQIMCTASTAAFRAWTQIMAEAIEKVLPRYKTKTTFRRILLYLNFG